MASVKPQALKRCIANLVANAIRFGKVVTVRRRSRTGALTIIVEDDGPGVPPERYADVFKPFVRLDDARNQDTPGTERRALPSRSMWREAMAGRPRSDRAPAADSRRR